MFHEKADFYLIHYSIPGYAYILSSHCVSERVLDAGFITDQLWVNERGKKKKKKSAIALSLKSLHSTRRDCSKQLTKM